MASQTHIVEFLGYYNNTEKLFIYMNLKLGSLYELVVRGAVQPESKIALDAFVHTLRALEYLASVNKAHLDVKPENILYSTANGGEDYLFQLGDIGLCRSANGPRTHRLGTPLYMAPEMWKDDSGRQDLADIYSLFVTMAWTCNTAGFHETSMALHRNGNHESENSGRSTKSAAAYVGN